MARAALIERTDAKIRYARLHVKELRECDAPGQGHDFERSHQEAFFAQLFGAYASLFQELNEDLGCRLNPESVTLGGMRSAMKAKGDVSLKLTELYTMERDPSCWLSLAKAMRDHITHLGNIPLIFFEGGQNHGEQWFRHPKTLVPIPGDYVGHLEVWVNEMEALIACIRR